MTTDPSTRRVEGPSTPPESRAGSDTPPAIRSDELLRGGNEILIDHAGSLYRLRLTRNGKLILHK